MGKPQDQQLSLSTAADSAESSGERESRVCKFVGLKCVLVLLLGFAVFLSVMFWLPPFSKFADRGDGDLGSRYRGHNIVASFKLEKPASFVKDNEAQLQADIYDELEASGTKVVILSLESSPGSNITKVVFAIDPETKHSSISQASQSLIRSLFESLVVRQTSLRLSTALFGKPYLFEVLNFPGGVTIIPPQSAFLLQRSQILFTFTLNFSIYQLQEKFDELRSQLKNGLHLASYENLYIRLENSRGSTVSSPAAVQASVMQAVGIAPSRPRLKQLAQTIKHSHTKNLGLNNTVFGKVKQVSLSSILQHSLGDISPSPAPAPTRWPHLRHHHHQQHRDSEDHGARLAPAGAPFYPVMGSPVPVRSPSPSPSPLAVPIPAKRHRERPRGCRYWFGYPGPVPEPSPVARANAPDLSPYGSSSAPHPLSTSPAPVFREIPSSSPLPSVIYTRGRAPPDSGADPEPPDKMPSVSAPSSPSAACHSQILPINWIFSIFLPLFLQL